MKKLGLNAAFAAGANMVGVSSDPYMAYNFVVEIERLITGGFTEGSDVSLDSSLFFYLLTNPFKNPINFPII